MKKEEIPNIGRIIKELRQKKKMSQRHLARGICTQAHISMIENEKEYPSCLTLYLIAKKLGVDINYFFSVERNQEIHNLNTTKFVMMQFLFQNEFEQALKIIEFEKNQPAFASPVNKQFLLWIEAECLYYNQDCSAKESLILLKQAVRETFTHFHNCTEQELLIINSIGLTLSTTVHLKRAIKVLKWVKIELDKLHYVADYSILSKNLYACARALSQTGQYHEAIQYCDKMIQHCTIHNSYYLLGRTYFEKGLNLHFLHKEEEAHKYFMRAQQIFMWKNQFHLFSFIEEKKRIPIFT